MKNRVVILQALLACCCSFLYEQVERNADPYSPWAFWFASQANPNLYPLVYSLINVGVSFGEGRYVISGSSLSILTHQFRKIPYKDLMVRSIEEEQYTIQCLQLLTLLLDIRMNEPELYKQSFVDSSLLMILDSYIELTIPEEAPQEPQNKKEEQEEEEKGPQEQVIQTTKNQILNPIAEKYRYNRSLSKFSFFFLYRVDKRWEFRQVFTNGAAVAIWNLVNDDYVNYIANNLIRVLRNHYDCENSFLPEARMSVIALELL